MILFLNQFTRFLAVGAINTGVDFGIYLALTRIVGVPYVPSAVVSVGAAMSVSYMLHKSVTFRNTAPHSIQGVSKFFAVAVSGLAINAGVVYAGVHMAEIYDLYAKIAATLIAMMWSYSMQKIWVFKA